jgi:uncharacterized protein
MPKTAPPQSAKAPYDDVPIRWLIKWGLITLVLAGICGYMALCLLFYQGQWQIVLHPSPQQAIPKDALPPYQEVHFAATEQGIPQLYGWWIPADVGSEFATDTIVFFPDGSGSLSDRMRRITILHQLGINVFAIDYRGFGNSAKVRPGELSLKEDASNTMSYLTGLRHIQPSQIVIYGEGLGAKPALFAATQVPNACCVILIDPRISQQSLFDADGRTHLLPMRWLIRDDFSLLPEISHVAVSKLIVTTIGTQTSESEARAVFDAASAPKQFLKLPESAGNADLGVFLRNTL